MNTPRDEDCGSGHICSVYSESAFSLHIDSLTCYIRSPSEILEIRPETVRQGQSRLATGCFGLAPASSRSGSCLRNRVAARDYFLSSSNFVEVVLLETTSVPIPVRLSSLAHQTPQIEHFCKQLT